MIKSIFKYLAAPGFFHASPKDVNPAQSIIEITRDNSEVRKKLKEEKKDQKDKLFKDVNRMKASNLFESEVQKLGISEERIQIRYHQHVMYGAIFLIIGLMSFILPIVGLFTAFDLHVPLVSLFLPTYTYPIFISLLPVSMLLFSICGWHFYLAKMIKLRQRFTFKQYLRSMKWLPTSSEVIIK